jgi:hypothetical protein
MRIFRYVVFSAFIVLLLFSLGKYLGYMKWERDFVSNQNIHCLESEDVEIDSKVEAFVLSDSMVEFVVFDIQEAIYILKNNLESSQYLSVENICVRPSKGVWRIYVK